MRFLFGILTITIMCGCSDRSKPDAQSKTVDETSGTNIKSKLSSLDSNLRGGPAGQSELLEKLNPDKVDGLQGRIAGSLMEEGLAAVAGEIIAHLKTLEPGSSAARSIAGKFGGAVADALGNLGADQQVAFVREFNDLLAYLPDGHRGWIDSGFGRAAAKAISDPMAVVNDLLANGDYESLSGSMIVRANAFRPGLVRRVIDAGNAAEIVAAAVESGEKVRFGILFDGMNHWAQREPEQASAYVAEMPAGIERDQAVSGMLWVIIRDGDFEAGRKWVDFVGNPDLKERLEAQLEAEKEKQRHAK